MTVLPPEFDVDLFDEDFLRDPYPVYARMRNAGPVLSLARHDLVAVTRYQEVRAVLLDHGRFVSGRGVGFNPEFNEIRASSVIASDSPRHEMLRSVLEERLSPRALRQLASVIRERAAQLVTSVLGRPSFDVVTELAELFPVQVVGELIGLPEDSRGNLLRWANGAFNAFGAPNQRTQDGLAAIREQFDYISRVATREQLAPGSMGAAVYEAADRGDIPEEYCLPLLSAYLTAGMDTTVNALGSMVLLLAQHPDQWRELRAHRSPLATASVVSEVLRLESPAQVFSRVAAETTELAGFTIAAGQRVAVLYGCGNRDERQYPDPDRFDIHRNPAGHLAFGAGLHACAGQYLALTELRAFLDELLDQVERITVGEPVMKVNNVLRGVAHLPATFTPATAGVV